MKTAFPRVVVVTRETEYQLLLARHATPGQAEFFLGTRGQTLREVKRRHATFNGALDTVLRSIPVEWRVSRLLRRELNRFLFEPEDTVVAVGQDGLVANVAKYLDGQHVIGVNPDRGLNDGTLAPHPPEAVADLLAPAAQRRARVQMRAMARVRVDDDQELHALNELFVGSRTHQSARYRIGFGDEEEFQSSSGIIASTGTGSSGWARSIHLERESPLDLPLPEEERMVFFVREAWPSASTGTKITEGTILPGKTLRVVSEMNEGGVIFGDGIEEDYLPFDWGSTARLNISDRRLALVV